MSNVTKKNYPPATAELAALFGMHESAGEAHGGHAAAGGDHGHEDAHGTTEAKHAKAPANLPAHDTHESTHDHGSSQGGHNPSLRAEIEKGIELAKHGSNGSGVAAKAVKTLAPYVFVFAAGLGLYFFFFRTVDFSSIFRAAPKAITSKQNELEKLMKENQTAYETWINSYYYDVSDKSVLDPKKDNSGNGLVNFEKFLLNLNPKSYDTLGLGISDSEAIAQGINPLTGGSMTDQQKQIVEKYFDMEVISNRLTVARMQAGNQVAGASTFLPVYYPPINTQYNPPVMTGPASGVVLDGASLDIDTAVPGRLEIPSLGVNAPVMWSSDPKNFDQDLQSGVIHYPGTALPGQIGTSYISGHSSNYAWAKGQYNRVFSKLGDLADYTSFKVTVVQKNGKDAVLHYVVKRRQEYQPTDQAQFENTGVSTVALSTCWPVGTTQKRLVVFGELTQVEKN